MFTHDGKNIVEYVEAMIEARTCEEMRAYWRSELKQRWPGASCQVPDEPDWNKRDLMKLYEDIDFGGSLEGTRLVTKELTTEFRDFKELPFHRTKMRRSVINHTSHNGQEVKEKNEVKVKKVLHWWSVITEYCRENKR